MVVLLTSGDQRHRLRVFSERLQGVARVGNRQGLGNRKVNQIFGNLSPGLRARARDHPLGLFPEGRGSRNRESVAPPGNDLGGIRRLLNSLSPRPSPRISNAGVFRSGVVKESSAGEKSQHWHLPWDVSGALGLEYLHTAISVIPTLNGACGVWPSSPGRPPEIGNVAKNA